MDKDAILEKYEQITPYERLWALIYASLLMLVTTLPYILGYFQQGAAWHFTGFVFGVDDGNSYIAKMLSGSAGAWLFKTPYSTFPQNGVLIFLPYILLGKLASPPGVHEQLVALYHLFRVIGGVIAVLATFEFISFYIINIKVRRFALLLATAGGGLGWVLVLLGKSDWLSSLPLEYYSPETFGFLGLYGIAHLSMARGLLFLTLVLYLKYTRSKNINITLDGLKIGTFWLLSGLFQPLAWVTIGMVMTLHWVTTAFWQYRYASKSWVEIVSLLMERLRLVIFSSLLSAPFVMYYILSFSRDPYLRLWTEQNYLPSPHFLHYLLAFGLLLPFAILGGRRLLRQYTWTGWLPVAWVLVLPVLAYAPFNVQRRFVDGIWVALVILALKSMDITTSDPPIITSSKRKALWLIFCLAFPSTIFLIAGGIITASNASIPVFRPVEEMAVFQYLGDRARPGEVVLSHYQTGNALPAWAAVRVVIGHGPESAKIEELTPQVAKFYLSDTSDAWRMQFIRELGVDYVFWGPAERSSDSWDPGNASYLELLYSQGDYAIFSVRK